MKVLDLRCSVGHIFEGWFGSEDDYQSQKERGLLQCPLCGGLSVEKTLSAPKLQAKSNTKKASQSAQVHGAHTQATPAKTSGSLAAPSEHAQAHAEHPAAQHQEVEHQALQAIANLSPDVQAQLQAHWLSVAREMVSKADDVGSDFANEARRIHYGDAPERAIHGEATWQEAQALIDEGVAVLPLPDGAKSTVQ